LAKDEGMSDSEKFGETVENWAPPKRPNISHLEGSYARLEPLSSERHAEEIHRANKLNDGIWDYLPYGPFEDLPQYLVWLKGAEIGSDPKFFAVRNLETNRAEGVASYLRIAPENGSIEVGHINFSEPLQRTRAASEAIYLMMEWAFEAGYRRFEWKCNALNIGSRRAAQRFGFSYEGIFRQATISKGRNRDTAWFACIDKEWPALKAAYETWLSPSNLTQMVPKSSHLVR
jgi:RimJ/RimL family protein N-acetyltransferase